MSSPTGRPSRDQRKASANRHFTPGDRSDAVRSETERAQAAMRAKSERLKALRLARDLAQEAASAVAPKGGKRK
ncbi:MAG: hypothetical protein U1E62_25225 [Alsobacter sp.]